MRRSLHKIESHSKAYDTIWEKNWVCTSKEKLAWAKRWISRAVRRHGKDECGNELSKCD